MSTPKYSRRAPAQRREEILDAANALFAERPYDEVSIEDIAAAAGVTRGLVHHYFGGRKDVYLALLQRLGAHRESDLRPPVGRSARARVADTVSRWLDWTQSNRSIWLATIAHGEDIADPDVRHTVTDLVHRAVAQLAAFHADIAEDSPRLRYALECWTALNRADAGSTAKSPARRRTSCSPRRSSTSCAPSELHPRRTSAAASSRSDKGRGRAEGPHARVPAAARGGRATYVKLA